jgi:hypothetical protein
VVDSFEPLVLLDLTDSLKTTLAVFAWSVVVEAVRTTCNGVGAAAEPLDPHAAAARTNSMAMAAVTPECRLGFECT